MKSAAITSRNWSLSFKLGKRHPDALLILTVFALMATGLVMIYSSSFIFAQDKFHDGLHFFKRQLVFFTMGLVAFAVGWRVPIDKMKRATMPILIAVGAALAFTLIPGISHKAGGAARWIGFLGFTFQPSELAKFAVILFVATQISRKIHNQDNWRSGFLTYFIGVVPLYILLLRQPDFGTTALCAGTTFLMLLASGTRARYLIGSIATLVPAAALLIFSSPYRQARVLGFLNPWSDPANKGFQVIQSFLAFHNGKLFGVGLGNSREKLFYLPEAHNDFIFAVIGAELGLAGVALVVTLFTIFVHRGLAIAAKLESPFEKALAAGITSMIGLQAFLNMAVVLGLLPTKGLPLPFVSYGGTAAIACLFMVGVLSQLSERAK